MGLIARLDDGEHGVSRTMAKGALRGIPGSGAPVATCANYHPPSTSDPFYNHWMLFNECDVVKYASRLAVPTGSQTGAENRETPMATPSSLCCPWNMWKSLLAGPTRAGPTHADGSRRSFVIFGIFVLVPFLASGVSSCSRNRRQPPLAEFTRAELTSADGSCVAGPGLLRERAEASLGGAHMSCARAR